MHELLLPGAHEQLEEYQLPEILRTPLEELCLQIKFWDRLGPGLIGYGFGSGCRMKGVGCGLAFRAQGSGFRVQGSGFR
eukprot:1352769-Rhodomonas_salina.4